MRRYHHERIPKSRHFHSSAYPSTVIARKDINVHLGGLISSGYLANLDSKGLGPKALKSGRRVAYLREDLVAWLEKLACVVRRLWQRPGKREESSTRFTVPHLRHSALPTFCTWTFRSAGSFWSPCFLSRDWLSSMPHAALERPTPPSAWPLAVSAGGEVYGWKAASAQSVLYIDGKCPPEPCRKG